MKLKRNTTYYAIATLFTDFYISAFHNIQVNGAENISKQGPGLIIPKHQFNKDIFVEGYLLNKYANRQGNWVMKSKLPYFLEKLGGIGITRLKDIKEIKNKKQRREYLEQAQQTNQKATDYMKWLYQNNELIVMHAEGTRKPNEMNTINMPLINYTQQVQKELGIKIPLILMGIEYENPKKFCSKVIVNIKELDWNTPNLEQAISKELASLSNIPLN